MREVLITAEHHNWGMHTVYDWQQTKYTLFEDGTLQSVIFRDRSIIAEERILKKEELSYIKTNIRDCVFNIPEIEACDGDAWQFEGPDFCFDLGYIYGSELEQIAQILEGNDR